MRELIDVFGINWKLLTIQIVNFGILLALLYRFLYAPLLRLMEERREKIAKGIKDAEEAEMKLTAADEKKSEIINQAIEQKESIIRDARQSGADQEKEIIRFAQEKSARFLADAKKAAAEEKELMVRQSQKEIADMIALSAQKIVQGDKAA